MSNKITGRIPAHEKGQIASVLEALNGKALAHTADAVDIVRAAGKAEKALEDFGLAKSNRKGAEAVFVSGEKLPNSYQGRPIRNEVLLQRGSDKWYVTQILKSSSLAPKLKIGLSEAQIESVMKAKMREHDIIPL